MSNNDRSAAAAEDHWIRSAHRYGADPRRIQSLRRALRYTPVPPEVRARACWPVPLKDRRHLELMVAGKLEKLQAGLRQGASPWPEASSIAAAAEAEGFAAASACAAGKSSLQATDEERRHLYKTYVAKVWVSAFRSAIYRHQAAPPSAPPRAPSAPEEPLLQRCELHCVSPGMKRLQDWCKRASSVGINAFSAVVPPLAFMSGPAKVMVDLDDIWVMFRLGKLDIRLMTVWCLMQQAKQEMRFTKDPFLHEGKKVGYLNPLRIREDEHTVVMGPNDNRIVGKSEAEIAKIRMEEQHKQETAVVAYIGNTFLQYQDRRIVCAPYLFKGHWVCMYIWLYDAQILVLDSADFPQSSYEKFIDILQRAYKIYKFEGGRYDLKKAGKPLHVRSNYPCHKQPQGSVHCGYYVCEFLRENGRYTNNPSKVYKCDPTSRHLLNQELMNICEDFSQFIMKEIIHFNGKYFYQSELARSQYPDLVDIFRKKEIL